MVTTGTLVSMTMPSWVSGEESKPAPMPLLLVQSFVNTWDGDHGSDLLLDPAAAGAWLTEAGLWVAARTPDACWPGPGCELKGLENWLRLCCTPAQAESRGAPRIKPTAVRRVAPAGWAPRDRVSPAGGLVLSGPTITSLLLTDRNRPERHPV